MKKREQLRAGVKILMEESGTNKKPMSMTSIAKMCNISPSVLSQWLNDKYPGSIERIDRVVQDFLARQKEKKECSFKEGFLDVRNARLVFDLCRMCHVENEIGVITGTAGLGKTTSLKEYSSRHEDVIMIDVDNTYTTKVLISEIHSACRLPSGKLLSHILFEQVVKKLKGSNRLLIIDEAEHLSVKTLDLVRRLHDRTGIGIVISGLPQFLTALRSRRGDYEYIYSRIGLKTVLGKWNLADTKTLVSQSIPGIFDSEISELGISDFAIKMFHEYSRGNARTLSKLVKRPVRLAKLNKRSIDKQIIKKASGLLEI